MLLAYCGLSSRCFYQLVDWTLQNHAEVVDLLGPSGRPLLEGARGEGVGGLELEGGGVCTRTLGL